MPVVHQAEFPYPEIRDDSGDYFFTAQDAMDRTLLTPEHIWAVSEADGVYTYGPSHHYINILGYIATDEPHDEDTYYEEVVEMA